MYSNIIYFMLITMAFKNSINLKQVSTCFLKTTNNIVSFSDNIENLMS